MSFNKSIFSFLVFGLLLQSCGSDAPTIDAKSKAEVITQTASRELADAKLDAMIDSATPSELETTEAKEETARQREVEEAEAKKVVEAKAKAEKDKLRKEKKVEREKKASEERRRKRRAKRKAKKDAEKLAVKQTASAEPIPVEYHSSTSHSSSKPNTASGTPVVSFYKTIHKYGTIEQGDKIEYKFRFKNTGKSELVVTDATASCGCTKPSYPFIPIEPGGEGYIGVIFDSKGKLGRQKPSVVITTNADPASYTIYLEGYVDSADKEEGVNNDENDKKGEDGKSF